MNLKSIFVLIVFGSFGIASCQHNKPNPVEKIEAMEAEMKTRESLDTALATKMVDVYLVYADSLPDDSLAPVYIDKAAFILKEMGGRKVLKSINTYNTIIHKYPEHPLAAKSIFMIGFVFDEKLHDTARALKSYSYFVETYPSHPLANDARGLITMLNDTISEAEMIRRWEQQNKESNPKTD